MNVKPAQGMQLRLMLRTHSPVKISADLEHQLVTALADLLVAVATSNREEEEVTKGGSDE